MENRKMIAGLEMMLMIVGLFAFAYGLSDVDDIFEKIKEPLIPIVSAQEEGLGCCAEAENGQKCGTTDANSCAAGVPFAEGALCAATSFCKKGCCYDDDIGIFDKNVLEADCSASWVDDPYCNMPEANLGCCVLGTESIFETQGQCEVDTLSLALGSDSIVDWRGNVGEGACLILSATEDEGACVLGNGQCEFGTEIQCLNDDGDFAEGILCSSPSLNTSCVMTEETTCVSGQDEVYFLDSCGNRANVYDSTRKSDVSYWDTIIDPADLCGDDSLSGNADSASCGNCNRFLGGICGSASEDNFNVDVGDSYCKDASCLVGGVTYRNGESWCVYDGAIGEGNDVAGSRHWKYVCSQGVTQIEPCADYRNQICVQTNTIGDSGVEFKNSACVANNWRKCIGLNTREDGLEECTDSLNCRVDNIVISDDFTFDACVPKYPGGFSLSDSRYQETAKSVCGIASQTCTVVRAPERWGGCSIVANAECLEPKFAEEMNNFCTGLGDCGGSANILGEFSAGGYNVRKSPSLGAGYINEMKKLANPVDGQYAELEDYTEYLAAAGLGRNPEDVDTSLENGTGFDFITVGLVGAGVAGIGAVTSIILFSEGGVGIAEGMSTFWTTLFPAEGATVLEGPTSFVLTGPTAAGFTSAAIGATIGFVVGNMLGQYLGLSEGGSMLMGIGGAAIGAAVMIQFNVMGAGALANIGFLLPGLWIAGVALIIFSFLFSSDDCPPIEVEFGCKPWQPPRGGDNCDECNGDPLKPCSEYRCNSLGASCEVVNKGTGDELCINARANDSTPPVLTPNLNVISGDHEAEDISDSGFVLTSGDGGCIDAYTNIIFGITTDEPSYCKFDLEVKEFDELAFDVGSNAYLFEHAAAFSLPDPSHGQSQGSNWTGDLSLYIKCIDTNGHESPGFYNIDVCVGEGDDRTSPSIRAISPSDSDIVGHGSTEESVTLITNELATCKWDSSDMDYSVMANSLECNDELTSPSSPLGYVCVGDFPVTDTENNYYIRCMDQPWLEDVSERNANAESFAYTLNQPEKAIEIDWITPDDDIESGTKFTTIELKVQTSGGGNLHRCSYSFLGYGNMIEMFETGEDRIHVQSLNRPSGRDIIYIRCSDETGESVEGQTEFRVIHDTSTPQIARIWQAGGSLYFVLSEMAECRYSTQTCNFNWDDMESTGNAERHSINTVRGNDYYIKCRDDFGNSPDGCSLQAVVL